MKNKKTKFIFKLVFPFMLAVVLCLIPTPDGLSAHAWYYMAIFVSLIVALILEPIPPAAIGFITVTICAILNLGPAGSGITPANPSDSIKWALSGFSNTVVWLIFIAFSIGLGFTKTGLGNRISLYMVKALGKSTLGIGYAIAFIDGILAPFIPSNSARSGGNLYPIVQSLCNIFKSSPEDGRKRFGAYAVWTAIVTCSVSSSMFYTAQTPNALAISLIENEHVAVVDWTGWFIAFAPVGFLLLILGPLLSYLFFPPEVKGSSEVVNWAKEEIKRVGPMTIKQFLMIGICFVGIVLWAGSSTFGINATTTALIIVVLMIACRIIEWDDFIGNKTAIGTFIWFGTLVTMASGLKNVGYLDWAGSIITVYLKDFSSYTAMMILLITFCFFRYLFASGTAYVTAMMAIYITIARSVPGLDVAETMLILILPMGIISTITPYSIGFGPLWYGTGYIKSGEYFKLGLLFALIFLAIYIAVGIPWIKYIVPKLGLL